MTPNQFRFYAMIEKFPKLSRYWDFVSNTEHPKMDDKGLTTDLGYMSSGEKHLAKFFRAVWLGNAKGFDIIEALKSVDGHYHQVIADWVADPFYP